MASGTEAAPHESSRQWLKRLREDRNEVGPEEIIEPGGPVCGRVLLEGHDLQTVTTSRLERGGRFELSLPEAPEEDEVLAVIVGDELNNVGNKLLSKKPRYSGASPPSAEGGISSHMVSSLQSD